MDLSEVLRRHSRRLRRIVDRAEEFRFQVLVSEEEVGPGAPQGRLRTHSFRADAEYFYPASAVKLCAGVGALMLVRPDVEDSEEGDGNNAGPMITPTPPAPDAAQSGSQIRQDPAQPQVPSARLQDKAQCEARDEAHPAHLSNPLLEPRPQAPTVQRGPNPLAGAGVTSPVALLALREGEGDLRGDPSNLNGGDLTLAHCIRKIFLVSDNEAFNVLFDIVGHRRLNETMWSLGLHSTALRHRLSVVMSPEDNRLCRPLLLTPEPQPNAQEEGPRPSPDGQGKGSKSEPDARAKGLKPESDAQGGAQQDWGSFCVPPKRSTLALPAPSEEELPGQSIGMAYIDAQGNLVPSPMDFSTKNRMALMDLHRLLVMLLRPDLLPPSPQPAPAYPLSQPAHAPSSDLGPVPFPAPAQATTTSPSPSSSPSLSPSPAPAPVPAPSCSPHPPADSAGAPEADQGYTSRGGASAAGRGCAGGTRAGKGCASGVPLSEQQRRFLLHAMAQYPRDSHSPVYDPRAYPDDYCKFFLPGLCRVRPKQSLRIYNKIGQAYGFTVDNACIQDVETGKEFFLSMVLYTNANGVLNDDKYEYDLAYAIAADVAEAVAKALWLRQPGPMSTGVQPITLFPAGWGIHGVHTAVIAKVEPPSQGDKCGMDDDITDREQPQLIPCYKYFLDS